MTRREFIALVVLTTRALLSDDDKEGVMYYTTDVLTTVLASIAFWAFFAAIAFAAHRDGSI